jgi:hypothetical protein
MVTTTLAAATAIALFYFIKPRQRIEGGKHGVWSDG